MTLEEQAAGARPLLEVEDLVVKYGLGRGRPPLVAVDGVTFSVGRGETLGLVGESGSGKSTIGRAILGLSGVADGTIRFDGVDITHATRRERRALSSDLQVVFQDPYSSLNPTRTIGQTLSESLRAQGVGRDLADGRVSEMLEQVGLPPDAARRYPRHFSGGQRQRIAIARALIVNPKLVVCDEPVSALDLSVQAQILNLLRELQVTSGVGYLFIAHDLTVVRHFSDRIMVVHRGRVVEYGDADAVYSAPSHPYTAALLAAAPTADPLVDRVRPPAAVRVGRLASGSAAAAGATMAMQDECAYRHRCPFAAEICREARPSFEVTPAGSQVCCHRWRELMLDVTPPSLRSERGHTAGGRTDRTLGIRTPR